MTNSPRRFETIYTEKHSIAETTRILRDNETGICYLQQQSGYGLALTPLLSAAGTPATVA